jgi:chromosome segregation and condensation protein ScpB
MSEKTKKVAELSPIAVEVLALIKTSEKPLTLAEIKASIPTANPAHLTALRTRELIVSDEVEVVVTSTRKVLAYSIIVSE